MIFGLDAATGGCDECALAPEGPVPREGTASPQYGMANHWAALRATPRCEPVTLWSNWHLPAGSSRNVACWPLLASERFGMGSLVVLAQNLADLAWLVGDGLAAGLVSGFPGRQVRRKSPGYVWHRSISIVLRDALRLLPRKKLALLRLHAGEPSRLRRGLYGASQARLRRREFS